MKKLKEYIKQPLTQLLAVIVILIGFWAWLLSGSIDQPEQPIDQPQQIQMKQLPDSIDYPYTYERFTLPDTIVIVEKESTNSKVENTESSIKDKYDFWDMVLGHLSSILGSLVALSIPIYRMVTRTKNKQ